MADSDSMDSFDDLFNASEIESQFNRAANCVQSIAHALANHHLLYLYARYKQGTEGPCNINRPGFFDFRGRQKWEAWRELGGMEREEAMREYVQRVREIDPKFAAAEEEEDDDDDDEEEEEEEEDGSESGKAGKSGKDSEKAGKDSEKAGKDSEKAGKGGKNSGKGGKSKKDSGKARKDGKDARKAGKSKKDSGKAGKSKKDSRKTVRPINSWVRVSTLQREEEEKEEREKDAFDFVKENDLEKIKTLDHSDLSRKDENGMTLLHWACDRGWVGIVKYLVGGGGVDINSLDNDKQTALHYAVSCGHVEIVKILLSHRARTDLADSDGLTAMDCADDDDIKRLFD